MALDSPLESNGHEEGNMSMVAHFRREAQLDPPVLGATATPLPPQPAPTPTPVIITTTVAAPIPTTSMSSPTSSSGSMSPSAAVGLGLGIVALGVLFVGALVLFYQRRRRRVRKTRVDPYEAADEETPMTNLRPCTSILKPPDGGSGIFSSVNDMTVMGGRGWVRLDNADRESFDYFNPHDAIPPSYDSPEVAGPSDAQAIASGNALASASSSSARASASEGAGARLPGPGTGTELAPTTPDATALPFRVLGREQGPRTAFRVIGRDTGASSSTTSRGNARHGGQESVRALALEPLDVTRAATAAASGSGLGSPRTPSTPVHNRVQSLRPVKGDLHRYDTFGRARKDQHEENASEGEAQSPISPIRGPPVAWSSSSHSKDTSGSGSRASRS